MVHVKTILGVYSASSVISRVSPKVRSANEPSSPDRKRAVTCGECTIDKRFLVPKIYPGSIVKNSGTYRYRSARRWWEGVGERWIILSVDIGAPLLKLERFARTYANNPRASRARILFSFVRSFSLPFISPPPLFLFPREEPRIFGADARDRADSSITYYRNGRPRTWRIMPDAICRAVFTVPHSRPKAQDPQFLPI